jgi:hypothetical protein
MLTVEEVGNRLQKALFESDNKENEVMEIALNYNNEFRVNIANYYQVSFGRDLQEDLKKNLSGNFRDVICDLFLDPIQFDVNLLKKAFKGFTGDPNIVMEILTSRPKEMIENIKEQYKAQVGKDLQKEIEKNFTSTLKKCLLSLLNTNRNENHNPDKEECEKCAKILESVKEENKWCSDEKIFNSIWAKKSPEELLCIGRYYYKHTGNILIDVIESKVDGKMKDILKEILYNNINPSELFAEKVYLAIKGLGTNTPLLNRVLVSRNEIDMTTIREIYRWKYKVEMKEDIIGDTSGIYQTLLVYLGEK